jgi:hypothetical protein
MGKSLRQKGIFFTNLNYGDVYNKYVRKIIEANELREIYYKIILVVNSA